jgi:hypothetical protein
MTAKWVSCTFLGVCLAVLGGCRTTEPNLKPEKVKEQLVEPPQEARFDSPGYPKQAYDKQVDPIRNAFDAKTAPGVTPTRGTMTPGAGGMGARP